MRIWQPVILGLFTASVCMCVSYIFLARHSKSRLYKICLSVAARSHSKVFRQRRSCSGRPVILKITEALSSKQNTAETAVVTPLPPLAPPLPSTSWWVHACTFRRHARWPFVIECLFNCRPNKTFGREESVWVGKRVTGREKKRRWWCHSGCKDGFFMPPACCQVSLQRLCQSKTYLGSELWLSRSSMKYLIEPDHWGSFIFSQDC